MTPPSAGRRSDEDESAGVGYTSRLSNSWRQGSTYLAHRRFTASGKQKGGPDSSSTSTVTRSVVALVVVCALLALADAVTLAYTLGAFDRGGCVVRWQASSVGVVNGVQSKPHLTSNCNPDGR